MNDRSENSKTVFGMLFFAANQLETICDRYLSKYNLTTKQFFLSLILIQAKEKKQFLTLTEASKLMGTSRQNVKQLASKLEERGFCKITLDEKDKRILRLSITQKNMDFWNEIDQENMTFLTSIFKNIPDANLKSMRKGLSKMLENLVD